MKKIVLALSLLWAGLMMAQVGINTLTPHASAELDVTSTTKGLLVPRLTTTAISNLTSTASEGLIVFNTTTKQFLGFNGSNWQLLNGTQIATFAGWDVSGTTSYGTSPLAATSTSMITSASLARGSGLNTTQTAANNAWGGNGFDAAADVAAAVSNNDFFTATLVLPATYIFSFTKIPAINFRRTATGPQYVQWQYSVNGGAFSNVGSATGPMSDTSATGNVIPETNLSSIAALQNLNNTTVVFRLVPYGGTGTGLTPTGYINNGNIVNDIEFIGTYY